MTVLVLAFTSAAMSRLERPGFSRSLNAITSRFCSRVRCRRCRFQLSTAAAASSSVPSNFSNGGLMPNSTQAR
jgi:hypothetical protein